MPVTESESAVSPLGESSPWRPGAHIPGGFELQVRLARGGFAEVWRARTADGADVALKVARTDVVREAHADLLIHREHAALGRLRHEHVLQARGLVAAGRRAVLVLDYCGAGDLISLLGFHPRHWARHARDLAVALDHVHAAGWVHCDIKPRNVLFDDRDRVVLADFSSAAVRGSASVRSAAAVPYRAVHAGDAAMPQDDIYAFSVLLHELVTGGWPEPGRRQLRRAVEREPALGELAGLIERVLEGQPGPGSLRRFADVLESLDRAFRSE